MKRLITFGLLLFILFSFKSPESNIYKGKLTKTQLTFIKNSYPWQDGEFLIVNFRQPISSCHYDNYKNINSSSGFDKFYAKIKLDNITNIFIYSDFKRAKKKIDSKKHFQDKNNFFFNNFFSKDKSCYGLIIINQQGDYHQKNGEYTQYDIVDFVNKLL